MRKLLKRKPLGQEGQQLAIRYWKYAAGVAYRVWREVKRPGRDWEEMRAESMLALVDLVAFYNPLTMPAFEKIIGRYVRWRMYRWIREQGKWMDAEPISWLDELSAPVASSNDNENIQQLMRILKQLPAAQREALEKGFGLDGSPQLTGGQAAKELGITPQAFNERKRVAIRNLRFALRGGLAAAEMDDRELKRLLSYAGRGR